MMKMKKLLFVITLISLQTPCTLRTEEETDQTRAPRQDLAPFLASNNCCAEIEGIKQCCCQLRNFVESEFDIVISLLDEIATSTCCDVIGNKNDIGYTSVPGLDPFTTLDLINAADISVISWLKSIMAQLHGV